MSRPTLFRSLVSALGAVILVSCAGTGPTDAASGQLTSAGGSGGNAASDPNPRLQALWWNKTFDHTVTVSETIDSAGGSISLPETGLTVFFPAGALQSPLTITITADDKYVAYRMEPSGTTFLKDVTVTQQLNATQVFGSPLQGQIFAAYIADDSISLSGKVPVLEIEPSTTILSPQSLPQAQVWVIRHFSRYMLASG